MAVLGSMTTSRGCGLRQRIRLTSRCFVTCPFNSLWRVLVGVRSMINLTARCIDYIPKTGDERVQGVYTTVRSVSLATRNGPPTSTVCFILTSSCLSSRLSLQNSFLSPFLQCLNLKRFFACSRYESEIGRRKELLSTGTISCTQARLIFGKPSPLLKRYNQLPFELKGVLYRRITQSHWIYLSSATPPTGPRWWNSIFATDMISDRLCTWYEGQRWW
ncbi:hypothetical protein PM082_004229 [Marasmius tenuissimus]|nr:hypothetical protein PM082_004229 [Marasmius tenuissimus]